MRLVLLALVALTACAAPVAPAPEAAHYTLVVPAGATAALIEELTDAAEDWNANLERDLVVVSDADADRVPGLYGHVYVELDGTLGDSGGWTTAPPPSVVFDMKLNPDYLGHPNTVRHELGHVLGLPDDFEHPDALMYWHLSVPATRADISDADVTTVLARWL